MWESRESRPRAPETDHHYPESKPVNEEREGSQEREASWSPQGDDDASSFASYPDTVDVHDEENREWLSRDRQPRGRISWVVSWFVILGLVCFLAWRASADPQEASQNALQEAQARYVVGVKHVLGELGGPDLAGQIDILDAGSVRQRLEYITLVNELSGPQAARDKLVDLRERLAKRSDVEVTPEEGRILESLERHLVVLVAENDESTLDADRELLRDELGWYGRLVVSKGQDADPAERREILVQARRTMWGLLGVVAWYVLLGSVGLLLLIGFVLLARYAVLRLGADAQPGYAIVYVETFALWLVVYLTSGVLLGLLDFPEFSLWTQVPAFVLSMSVLFWPCCRGVPFARVREDIGLNFGRGRFGEPLFGGIAYAMSLPLLAVGALVMFLLGGMPSPFGVLAAGAELESFEPVTAPSHPISEHLASGDLQTILAVFLLACVFAPIGEEIFFRGFLQRALRETSAHKGRWISWLLSSLFSSFIFAAIHPQGMAAVPPLMALAIGFCLAREWRGSLVPGIVAHGINNFVTLLASLLLLG